MFLLRKIQQRGYDPNRESYNSEESPLPSGWIALNDPSSDRTYYSNSSSGETTWERPMPTSTGVIQYQQQDQRSNTLAVHRPQPFLAQAQAYDSNKHNYSTGAMGGTAVAPRPIPTNGNESPSPLQPKWASFTDQASGKRYYRNLSTGEMKYDLNENESSILTLTATPVLQPSPTSASNGMQANELTSPLPPGWEAMKDQMRGKTYYQNTSTGEASWEKPVDGTISQQVNVNGFRSSTSPTQTNNSQMIQTRYSTSPTQANNSQVQTHYSTAPTKANDPLPPGWAAVKDDASGKTCYANASTGELRWEKPIFMTQNAAPSQRPAMLGESYEDHPDTISDELNNSNTDEDGDEFEYNGAKWVRKGGWEEPPPIITARNHSYLWLCCDMRKAVFLTNGFVVAACILFIVMIYAGVGFLEPVLKTVTDGILIEVNYEDVEAWFKAASGRYYEVSYASASICFSLMGFVGAYKFNSTRGRFNIFIAAVPLILYTLNIAGLIYILIALYPKEFIAVTVGCVANVIFAYPHLVFISEIKRGVINNETYNKSTESHWCCCSKQKARVAPTPQTKQERYGEDVGN